MIKVINPSRLTCQPFFHELINYLDRHDDVTLREIKHEFANFSNIDRSMEEYISKLDMYFGKINAIVKAFLCWKM